MYYPFFSLTVKFYQLPFISSNGFMTSKEREFYERGYGKFPYILIRVGSGLYKQVPIHFGNSNKSSLEGYFIDEDDFSPDQYKSICRNALKEVLEDENCVHNLPRPKDNMIFHLESSEPKKSGCVVTSSDYCVYSTNGDFNESDSLPWGGTLLSLANEIMEFEDGNHFIKVESNNSIKFMLSRFGGGVYVFGQGKLSDQKLPKDSSFDNIIDNHLEELLPNFKVISSYDMCPSWMGAYKLDIEPNLIKLCEIHHTLDMPLQYNIDVISEIYITNHKLPNVYSFFLRTKDLDLVYDNFEESIDYVLAIYREFNYSSYNINSHPKELALMLTVLLYKMELLWEDSISSIKASDSQLGDLLTPEVLDYVISGLYDVTDKEDLMLRLKQIEENEDWFGIKNVVEEEIVSGSNKVSESMKAFLERTGAKNLTMWKLGKTFFTNHLLKQ